jgi:hypothetical protein
LNLSLILTFSSLRRLDCLIALPADLVFGIVDLFLMCTLSNSWRGKFRFSEMGRG